MKPHHVIVTSTEEGDEKEGTVSVLNGGVLWHGIHGDQVAFVFEA